MQIRITPLFLSDQNRYDGVPPIKIYILKLVFLLAFIFVGKESWTTIITHPGPWEALESVTFSVWAAYSTLSIVGVFYTLKMLPMMLFIVFYKAIWLVAIAYPLWISGQLAGSPMEGLAYVFIWVIIPLVGMPWSYVFRRYFRNEDKF